MCFSFVNNFVSNEKEAYTDPTGIKIKQTIYTEANVPLFCFISVCLRACILSLKC